jgi:DNA-binding SARP family transcriptional activator/ABC-type branched-subunit amino acid transport system substrate-binding protein
MDFHILGALEVTRDGRPVALGGGRQRALLALLLIERNSPVDGDRIVEALWNGGAPATAAKIVQNLVSQLRRGGADGILRTRGHGYELTVPDGRLDAARFERALESGRAALARGDPEAGSAQLGEALAIWRGPALAEFAGEPWARTEAARLEERRLVALEHRIDADLQLGRHADLVGELESAVAREPLREGLRSRLMLALYRSGRQAEALAAFQSARRTLVEELGIEPGPALTRLHDAILAHDPALDPPDPPDPPTPTGPRRPPAPARRRAGALLAAGGVALLAAAVAAVALVGGKTEGAASTAGGGALVALDARTGKVVRQIPAGRTPAAIAAGAGRVWIVDGEARTVLRTDRASGDVETLATGGTPTDVAVTAGAVWVADGTPREGAVAVGPTPDAIVRIDPATHLERSVPLPRTSQTTDTTSEARVAAAGGAVWALTADASVMRIDPATVAVTQPARDVRARAIAAAGAGLWAIGLDGKLLQLDEHSGAVRRRIRLPSPQGGTLAVGDDAAWVAGFDDGRLYRIGRSGGVGSVAVGDGVTDVAVDGHFVWTVSPITGTVTTVDATSMRVVRTLQLAGEPRSLAVDGGTIWVGVTRPASPLSTQVAGVRPLPASRCEPVLAGNGGRADALVVSDLPLQGDTRLSSIQMAQAITFVLREHGFRAGRFRIAYQSCDDALASTGLYDPSRCAANGRAYAGDADVIGVIGTFNSGCAEMMLPELNRAAGAPVPMVSPLNSYVGLTRSADVPGLLTRLYPTGRRNFVRVYPTDDMQSGALARLAHDRGDARVFVLDDGYAGYSELLARAFTRASRRLGLTVAGHARWDPATRSFGRLVDRVAAVHPDAVFVAGVNQDSNGQLIRAVRRRLGRATDIMGGDSLAPAPLLEKVAGPAARGVFVGATGVTPSQLPPAGARFAARFARTQPGAEVESVAVYAAQATEVMLDAIARSDGTRASLLGQVFRTRLRGSLIGDVAFDSRGDALTPRVTVLRVVGGGSVSGSFATEQGATVERVDTVRPGLIR